MNADTVRDLLAELAVAPAFPGALCRGRPHLFDGKSGRESTPAAEARYAQALALCERCPSLERCGDWLDGLPRSRRPLGVVAGRIRAPKDNPITTTEETP